MTALVVACLAGTASADVVCADSSYCEVSFSLTFLNDINHIYNPGGNYDVVTISPDGLGQTFADPAGQANGGIDIRVYARNCQGDPLQGIPATEVVLYNSLLCICPGGNAADAATDVNGCTTFSGSIAGGGCAATLDVYIDGVFICTIPVGVNAGDSTGNCATDAGDTAKLSSGLGTSVTSPGPIPPSTQAYTICLDFTEDGFIDAGDIGNLASLLAKACL
jgi:hypothetical protein